MTARSTTGCFYLFNFARQGIKFLVLRSPTFYRSIDHLLKVKDETTVKDSYPATITLGVLRSGMSVKYVPIKMRKRKTGKSNIKLIQDGARFFIIITRILHPVLTHEGISSRQLHDVFSGSGQLPLYIYNPQSIHQHECFHVCGRNHRFYDESDF